MRLLLTHLITTLPLVASEISKQEPCCRQQRPMPLQGDVNEVQ
jgi:hypothetical protein